MKLKEKKDISNDNPIQVPEIQNMEIEEPVIEEVTETSTFQTSSKKHKKHKKTEDEEQILKQLEYYKEAFLLLPEIVNGLVEQLVEVEQSLKLPKY